MSHNALVVTISKTGKLSEHLDVFDDAPIIHTEKDLRDIRDTILQKVVDPVVNNNIRWNQLSEDMKQRYYVFRQALLDIPQQDGFPDSIVWPQLV